MYNARKQRSAEGQEVCRMSWFLIEVLQSKDSTSPPTSTVASRKRDYFIIHSVDIIDSDSVNMYVDCFVRFNHNQEIIDGKVKLASDDRARVEQEMQRLMGGVAAATKLLKNKERSFLVQYVNSCDHLIHAVLQEHEVIWPKIIAPNQRQVMIHDGLQKQLAMVLYANDDEELTYSELQKLKTWCFEKAFDKHNQDTTIADDAWLLVQYSSSPANLVYTVLNVSETCWQQHNLYKDVVAYLNDGQIIYQALILRKSDNVNELKELFYLISGGCQSLTFPLSDVGYQHASYVELTPDVENLENVAETGSVGGIYQATVGVAESAKLDVEQKRSIQL